MSVGRSGPLSLGWPELFHFESLMVLVGSMLGPLGRLPFYFVFFGCILLFSVVSVLVNSCIIVFAACGIVNIGGVDAGKDI